MTVTKEMREFINNNLGLGHTMVQLKDLFNSKFSLGLTLDNFKFVLLGLEIDWKTANKAKFLHNIEEFMKVVRGYLGKGLNKSQIYDEVNKEFPCTLTAFNNITKEIDWKKENVTVFTVTIEE